MKGADTLKDTHKDEMLGVYQATSRGFGFFSPEGGRGRQDDWFVPPRAQGSAWDGDKVAAVPAREDREEGRRVARTTTSCPSSGRSPAAPPARRASGARSP